MQSGPQRALGSVPIQGHGGSVPDPVEEKKQKQKLPLKIFSLSLSLSRVWEEMWVQLEKELKA
jgi:hypothetical protein